MKKKLLLLGMLLVVFASPSFAIKVEFNGDLGSVFNASYGGKSVSELVTQYVTQYTEAIDPVFIAMADSFATSNTTLPIFGEPYRNLAFGVNGGIAFSSMHFDPNKAGGEQLEAAVVSIPTIGDINAMTIGAGVAPFVTISLHPLKSLFGIDFFADSDLTFKLLPIKIGKDGSKFRGDFFSTGLMFRKQFIESMTLVPVLLSFEGVGFSFGMYYSKNTVNLNIPINVSQTMLLDASTKGTVSFSANDVLVKMETKSLTLDGDIKGYINLLYILDLFAGLGLSVNFSNNMDVSGNFTGTIKAWFDNGWNGSGFTTANDGNKVFDTGEVGNTSNAGLRVSGDGKGASLIPRFMIGTQLNLGPVKIPLQYTIAWGKNTIKNLTFGLSVSF